MLSRLVESQRSGLPPDEAASRRAEGIAGAMGAPAPAGDLPKPADAEQIAAAEARIGSPLPPLLRRALGEVADGGWGPGGGLLSAAGMADRHAELRAEPPSETDEPWPEGLLPLVGADDDFDCLELSSGRVVLCEFEEREEDGEQVFGLAFREEAPTLEAWFGRWLERG
jgi:hypothetical protein